MGASYSVPWPSSSVGGFLGLGLETPADPYQRPPAGWPAVLGSLLLLSAQGPLRRNAEVLACYWCRRWDAFLLTHSRGPGGALEELCPGSVEI